MTKFEPTHARRAFPCMDEPAMKAEFKLTLIRHKDFTATYSNTPILTSIPVAGSVGEWITDTFKTSVKMSTYLIAYAITDFTQIEAISATGVKIEVSARPKAISDGDGDFALQEATDIIDFFAGYFDVPYPLDKSSKTLKIAISTFYFR